jgi:2-dehydropantoate 2-reductase
MKFAILGAGALGTILGAHLSRAGHDVVVIARGERARTLQRQGLVLNGLSDIKARCPIVDDPKKLRDTGTLIIATKAIDTAQAIDSLKHLDLENAFSVQNGVMKNELLARVFGYSRVLGCMADFSGELLANGEVKFTRNVCLHIGEEKGGTSPRAEALAAAIDGAGVRCVAAPNIRTREWSKFVGWIASFPLAVLTRQITWKYMMDERSASVIVSIVREAAALAKALDIELVDMPPLPVPSIAHGGDAEAIRIIQDIGRKFLETSPEHRMSAQQDVLRGSRLEYEETLGFAITKAREAGVPMPTLDALYRIIAVAFP